MFKIKRSQRMWWAIGIGLGLGMLLIISLAIVHVRQSSFPSSIKKQAGFSIFYPGKGSVITPLHATISYDAQAAGVAYTVLVDSQHVIISEQATPAIFSQAAVLQYKLQQSHEYATLSSSLGQLTLTKPDGLNGQVVAVIDTKGTLIFAHALQTISDKNWLQLFNSLEIIND